MKPKYEWKKNTILDRFQWILLYIWQNVGWCDDSREDQEIAVSIVLFVLPRQYNNNNGILKVTDVHPLNSKQSVPALLP